MVDITLITAEEILGYAEKELEKAIKTGDMLLYRNAADKAFLSMVVAVNSYLYKKLGVTPKTHKERRFLLRKLDKENLRAIYSDVMRTLYDEAYYEGIFNPEEVKYALMLIKKMLDEFKKE